MFFPGLLWSPDDSCFQQTSPLLCPGFSALSRQRGWGCLGQHRNLRVVGRPPGPCCLPRSVQWETRVPPCSAAVRGEARSFPEPQALCLEDTPPLCPSRTPPADAAPFPVRDTPSRSEAAPVSCLPLCGHASPSQAQRGGSAQGVRAALVLHATGMRASAPKATTSSELLAARRSTHLEAAQSPHAGGDRVVFTTFTLRKF